MATIEQRVAELVAPVLEEKGIELWGVKLINNPKRTTLQIFIDKKDGGVTIDDCTNVSLELNGIMDVEDLFNHPYFLEVSSPGLDRYLFTFDQVCAYTGREMNVEVSMPIANRRRFRGILEKVDGDLLFLKVDNDVYEIAWPNVSKAQLIPVI
ncbi:ribosome maturation factor RimP [Ruminobacter sp.]|uniref:ribosome maturation factor RimP n=1 Tax=Ruminobacter sp. TaxID=2774296 RepID=UPI001B2E29E0|nr:ribosome maturation factor RimP [Ruminobacter sp.]MBO6009922.1 ribosome maturation factor RimP [Ruminobacter sp.]MBP3747978.1 ribosome maturation factor RimP [Ruminobacter sp.]